MSVARSVTRMIGTDETTGDTIANNTTDTGSEIDMLGNNTSEGNGKVFIKYTSTGVVGSIDIKIFDSTISGQSYQDQAPLFQSIVPINGTQKIPIGDVKLSRFMTAQVFNNAVGASLTNVTVTIVQNAES